MKTPEYPVVVVHGISDKTDDQQSGFSNVLGEKVMPDQSVRDKYWIEAVWEPVNNALDDKIQDIVLQLVDVYDKTTYWRDSELATATSRIRKSFIWMKWALCKLFTAWFVQKTTRALDLVLDLPMYLGNPKGEKIRAKVREAINKALDTKAEGVILVGHSLGSVIAYDVIRELKSEKGEKFPIKAFITMGSPLDWVTDLRIADKELPDSAFNIGDVKWINFYDEQDPVPLNRELPRSRFPDVQNERAICSGKKYIDAHTVYWQRDEIAKKIASLCYGEHKLI